MLQFDQCVYMYYINTFVSFAISEINLNLN